MIFEKSIYLLNLMIHGVASIESFVIKDISFNSYYLFTFYFLIISSIVWLKKPSYSKLVFMFSSIILVQLSFILTKIQKENERELIVYNEKNNTLISKRTGSKIVLFTRDTVLEKNSKNRNITPYLVGNSILLTKVEKTKNLLYFKNKKILIINSTAISPFKLKPDVLILTQSPKINLDRLLQNIHPEIIISDGSNSNSIQNLWKNSCTKKNIPFHSTTEKGYYKL